MGNFGLFVCVCVKNEGQTVTKCLVPGFMSKVLHIKNHWHSCIIVCVRKREREREREEGLGTHLVRMKDAMNKFELKCNHHYTCHGWSGTKVGGPFKLWQLLYHVNCCSLDSFPSPLQRVQQILISS